MIMNRHFVLLISIFFIFLIYVGIFAKENEFFDKGLLLYKEKEFRLAALHLEEAKKFDFENSDIYFFLGNTYYELDDLDSAILNYTRGMDYTDKKGIFFYNLGNCYYLKRNYTFSSEMYTKAISYDPTIVDSYLNSGNAYYKIGDYENTIIQWETYLKKYPQTPQYEKIEKAIAYLRGELESPDGQRKQIDEKTGLDIDLFNETLRELDRLVQSTENVLEQSEKPVDDLSSEEIER